MRTLSVPDLAGGINNRDGITDILDNQLNNAKNLWFKDGVLRTRPGKRIYGSEKITTSGPMENTKHFFDDPEAPRIEKDTVFNLIEKDGRWIIESNIMIYDDITGGYMTFYYKNVVFKDLISES